MQGDWKADVLKPLDDVITVRGPNNIVVTINYNNLEWKDMDYRLVRRFTREMVDLLNRQLPEEHLFHMIGIDN